MNTEKKAIAYLVIGKGMKDLLAFPFKTDSYIIGIDRGAYLLAANGLRMDEAVGDFDSVDREEFETIEKHTDKITKLSNIKDDSDTYHAYMKYKDKAERIVIVGGIEGKRIEHFLANLLMLENDTRISLVDDVSKIYALTAKDEEYSFHRHDAYYSFFPIDDCLLSLRGFKYPLERKELKRFNALGLSNELLLSKGFLRLEKGKILVIETNKATN